MKEKFLRASVVLLLAAFVAALSPSAASAQAKTSADQVRQEIAVTFDDLPLNGPQFELERLREMTSKLLKTFAEHRIPVVGFVNERQLYRAGEIDERVAVLKMWVDAGLELGNHTFSHPSLQRTPVAAFQDEVIRGETVTRMLLTGAGKKLRYFRHPFLQTGPTLEVRATFEGFLKERGYTIAPVTVDNSDWMFNSVYTNAKTRGDRELMKRVGEAYVSYVDAVFDFHERASLALFARPIKHTLLLHANELNADYFGEVAGVLKRRGYSFITLEEALQDEAYAEPDKFAGPSGVSWLYRWDFTRGKKQINWREEPPVPEFVRKIYEDESRSRR